MATKYTLSPPWVTYYHEIEAFFAEDPEVRIVYFPDEQDIRLYVDNSEKAAALENLLPSEKVFGGVCLHITIVPANGELVTATPTVLDIAAAFEGNYAVEFCKAIEGIYSNPMYYIIFKKKVVQYYTDDLGDYYGMRSTLYQDIANEIFVPVQGVYYCTSTAEADFLGEPLGEWP